MIDAYKEISKRFDYPLHLGVTHAGPKETGTIRSVVPLGHLLASGIGDTIRISYANDPVYEVQDGLELLYVPRPAHAHRRRADRLPDLRADPGRSVQARAGRPQAARGGDHAADQGGGDGLRRERPRRMRRRRHRDLRRRSARASSTCRARRSPTSPRRRSSTRLLEECRKFQAKVERGEAKLGEKKVDILPPDPLGELGSGWEKIQREKGTSLPVVR